MNISVLQMLLKSRKKSLFGIVNAYINVVAGCFFDKAEKRATAKKKQPWNFPGLHLLSEYGDLQDQHWCVFLRYP